MRGHDTQIRQVGAEASKHQAGILEEALDVGTFANQREVFYAGQVEMQQDGRDTGSGTPPDLKLLWARKKRLSRIARVICNT